MDLGISGRRALICGGSRGLGRATAQALAEAGVLVTLAARTQATLEQAAAVISGATGVAVRIVAGDITTAAGRAAALAACPDPDILVTNSDGPLPGDFRQHGREDWIAALDALMITPIELIRATLDGMAARKFGRIVNIVSRSVKIAQSELSLSNGARAGLVGFVAGIARSAVADNVTINNLLPGIFETDAQRRHITGMLAETGRSFEDLWAERAAGNPAKRYGRADEFGNYCAFLCSAHAGFITGQNLLIDGGSYPGTF